MHQNLKPELVNHHKETDHLANRLEEVRQEALAFHNRQLQFDFLEALAGKSADPQDVAAVHLRQFTRDIQKLVVDDPRFLGSERKMIRPPNARFAFYPEFVAEKLVQRTLEGGSASESIEWLQKVLGTSTAMGSYVAPLWNVSVASEVQLTSEVALVPFDSLQESHDMKRLKMQHSWHMHQISFSAVNSLMDLPLPSSALVIPHRVDPFISGPDKTVVDNLSGLQGQILDVALILTLIGPRVPIQAAQWFSFDDLDLDFAVTGHASSGQVMEILPLSSLQPFPPLDAAEAQKVIGEFSSCDPKCKNKIVTAVRRLSQALLRHQPGDRAVEVSIALETLLGGEGNTEMTHKVTVRAVRLLGGETNTRLRNAAILKKTYAFRSQLVHRGEHASKSECVAGARMTVEEIISEACSLCATLIKRIIARGGLPKWEEYDIGSEDSTPSSPAL